MSSLSRFVPAGGVAAALLFSPALPAHADGYGAGLTSLSFSYAAPDANGCRTGFTVAGSLDGAIMLAGGVRVAEYSVSGVPAVWADPCVTPYDGWVPFDAHIDGTDQDGHAVACYVGVLLSQYPFGLAGINGDCTLDGGAPIHLDASLRGETVATDDALEFRGEFLGATS
jgi:hypothetical protein